MTHARSSAPGAWRARAKACLGAGGLAAWLLPLLLIGGSPARALEWTILVADEAPAQTQFAHQFVQALRETTRAGAGEEDPALAGVRTRSLSPRPPAAGTPRVTIAVGPAAARSALARPGEGPLLLALLSRLDHEALKTLPALQHPERPLGVLLREPALADQLTLIDALLPGKRRLGLVVTGESQPVLRELRAAAASDARGWSLQVEHAADDPAALGAALRAVLLRSDALLVLPDRIAENPAATLAVLRAGASAGLPVFGVGVDMVRAGALAAAVSTPGQLARQAHALGERLAAADSGASRAPWVETAGPPSVRLNRTVARGLNLHPPSEQALTQRLAPPGPTR